MNSNPVNRFSQLSPEEQDAAYDKIVDDRDTALRVSASMSRKVEILASHVVIKDGKLKVVNPRLTKYETKALSECLEEEL